MSVRPFKNIRPELGRDVYVDPDAVVIGRVKLHDGASIWPGAVLRGDVNRIEIGARTNIQDNAVVHVRKADSDAGATIIGAEVTVGHLAHLHACRVADRCLIGSGSIILDHAEIGEGCIIAAGAVVSPGAKIPPRTLLMGVPAKPKRSVTDVEYASIIDSANNYVGYAKDFLKDGSQRSADSDQQ